MTVTKCAQRVAIAAVTCENKRSPKALVTPRGRLTLIRAIRKEGPR